MDELARPPGALAETQLKLVSSVLWLFILWRRPFELGDRIQIGEDAGDVIDSRIFQFTILEIGNWVAADQSTGRLIHIPNQSVFTTPLANHALWERILDAFAAEPSVDFAYPTHRLHVDSEGAASPTHLAGGRSSQ